MVCPELPAEIFWEDWNGKYYIVQQEIQRNYQIKKYTI